MDKAEEVRKIIVSQIENGMTAYEIARRSGCLPRTVSYWKTGERKPSLNQADKVLKSLGISVTIGAEEE